MTVRDERTLARRASEGNPVEGNPVDGFLYPPLFAHGYRGRLPSQNYGTNLVSLDVSHPAIFLDRDGVLNVDRHYVCRVEDFQFVDGVFAALRAMARLGFRLVIVTNQSAIGRGMCSQEQYDQLTEWMVDRFAEEGILITAIYCCPHSPDQGCDCRKPAPGMILRAAREHNLDLRRSWMIGDQAIDLEAARRAGVPNSILVADPDDGVPRTIARPAVCRSLEDAARWIARRREAA